MKKYKDLSTEERKTLEDRALILLQAEAARQESGEETVPVNVLEELKRIFQQLRPIVDIELVNYLADQQARHSPPGRLFEDIEDDIALWAHNRALGGGISGASSLPETLTDGSHLIDSIFPKSVEWGASGHLQATVPAALDSPILHAWLIYRSDPCQPIEITVTGRGTLKIHREVMASVLRTILAVEPKIDDFIQEGVMKLLCSEPPPLAPIEAPKKKSFFGLLFPFRTHRSMPSSPVIMHDVPQSAAEAMLLLRGDLIRLQNETGLVVIHESREQDKEHFLRLLAEYQMHALEGDPQYWCDTDGEASHIVTTIAYQKLPGRALRLTLAADVLNSPRYNALVKSYQDQFIHDVLVDLHRREHFYREELRVNNERKKWYENLSEEEKSKLPPEEVTHKIDFEAGLSIRLTQPEEIEAAIYYTVNVPFFITHAKDWLEKILRFKENIERALNHHDAPLERLCAARLLDCAWRDMLPSDDEETNRLFKHWAQEIQPLLWCEWRKQLDYRDNINPTDVCTRHSFLNLNLIKDKCQIILTLCSIIDSRHSVIIFDSDSKVSVINDPTDFAEQRDLLSYEADALKSYNETKRLAEGGGPTKEIRRLLYSALLDAPQKVGQRIVEEWIAEWPEIDEELTKVLREMNRKTLSNRAAIHAFQLINFWAFNTAEEILKGSGTTSTQHSAVLLMKAYLECFKALEEPIGTLQSMLQQTHWLMRGQKDIALEGLPWRGNSSLEHIWHLFLRAYGLNPGLVKEFCDKGMLRTHAHPEPLLDNLTPPEQGAMFLVEALDAASVAMVLTKSIGKINPIGESRRSAYANVGPAIETALTSPFAPRPHQLQEVVELTLGMEVTTWPQGLE